MVLYCGCTHLLSNPLIRKLSLWFQHNSTKESYDTNRIVCTGLKGELRVQYKLGSNERAWKIQKNEPSLTFMCQLVFEISQFKVQIFPSHKYAAIFLILSLVLLKISKVWRHSRTTENYGKIRREIPGISSIWICLKFYRFIEFGSTIQLVFKIRCYGNWNENNCLLLKRQSQLFIQMYWRLFN